MSINVERRDFLKGAATLGATAAVAGLIGCASTPKDDQAPQQDEGTQGGTQATPDVVKDCDVVVCGTGISGLAAIVQAAELGARVIALEAAPQAGGNGLGVEGSFANGSPLQKEQGISFDFETLIAQEMAATQYRVDARLWRDLYDNSGANIEWLISNGVEFSGDVNDYGTGAGIVSMHWYKDGSAGVGYVPPMVAKAQELGVEFMYSTKAEHPVMDGAKVVGVTAKTADGETVQVNAKAVILATGGFGADLEMLRRIGYNPDNIWYYGSEQNDGGGLRIGLEAGARDFSWNAADNAHAYIRALPHEGPVHMPNCGMAMAGCMIWINQDAERFVREDCGVVNFCQANPPRWNQKEWYFVFDTDIYHTVCGMFGVDQAEGDRILADSVATNEGNCLYMADTIEGLAEPFGLDGTALAKQIADYNSYCETGVDSQWCKDAPWLVPCATGPFYIAKPETLFLMTIGAVGTDRNGQAVTEALEPIEGLYAVGVDGCMLYRNVYTIDAPGSCSGNAINMGRTAAKHACSTL